MEKIEFLGVIVIIGVLVLCYYLYNESDSFQLKCIVSTVDGNKYCVRDRKRLQESADLLATVTEKCKKLVEYVYKKHPDMDNVKRLHDGFNPKKVMEI
jgi:hypothetical protein